MAQRIEHTRSWITARLDLDGLRVTLHGQARYGAYDDGESRLVSMTVDLTDDEAAPVAEALRAVLDANHDRIELATFDAATEAYSVMRRRKEG
ncbi:MAG: hypothetical protein AB7R89_06170 [Dehalococcoidia bacterium]